MNWYSCWIYWSLNVLINQIVSNIPIIILNVSHAYVKDPSHLFQYFYTFNIRCTSYIFCNNISEFYDKFTLDLIKASVYLNNTKIKFFFVEENEWTILLIQI